MCLTTTFRMADRTSPATRPGIAKVSAYTIMVAAMLLVLKPKALNMPNSYVFSSTSDSISE